MIGIASCGGLLLAATLSVKPPSALAPLGSVAVTVTVWSPAVPAAGVPEIVPPVSMPSPLGRPAAVNVNMSLSGSEKYMAAFKLNGVPSVAFCGGIGLAVGGWFAAATCSVKPPSALAPLGSVAVTVTVWSPAVPAAGVPEIVPAASMPSPLGRPAAVNVNMSLSGSEKYMAAFKLNGVPSVAFCGGIGLAVGGWFAAATCSVKPPSALAPLGSVAVTVTVWSPAVPAAGVPEIVPAASMPSPLGRPAAVNVNMSLSGSEKYMAAFKLNGVPSVAFCGGIELAVGGWLADVTWSVYVSLVITTPSEAVTVTA